MFDAPKPNESNEGKSEPRNAVSSEQQHIIDEMREQWRRRQAWVRAEVSLTLTAKAFCRRLVWKGNSESTKKEAEQLYKAALGGGKKKVTHELAEVAFPTIYPLIQARKQIEDARAPVDKRMEELVSQLPIAKLLDNDFLATLDHDDEEFAAFVPGFLRGVGIGSLAAIIAESGALSNYANPAKLWKRMGLAVMPDGTRQRRVKGAEALAHGYNPVRRSIMWIVGDCIVKSGSGPLRDLYDKRKQYELDKAAAEGLIVAPSAKIPAKKADQYRSQGVIHLRAKRYVEKRVLVLLWRAWRKFG
jgi:hypothetical protein